MIKIMKPNGCGDEICFAEQELKFFLSDYEEIASDCPIAEEDTFISLGNTEFAQKFGFSEKIDGLKDFGFAIYSKNRGYYIVAPTERGVRFGVYSLLRELCGLEIYAEDEMRKDEQITYKDICLRENPTFDFFDSSWLGWNKYSSEFAKRCRLSVAPFVNSYHSFFEVLPKEKYLNDHLDWYSEKYTQLCLTNEEMTSEFIKNAYRFVDERGFKKANVACFMVGQEDNGAFCQCERCKKSYEKYGVSGTLVHFVNKVARALNEYAEEKYPSKTIKTVMFAYGTSANPPVDENCKPIDESVMLEKNVIVMNAPITANYTKPLYDEKSNANICRTFKGYSALGAEMYLWVYNSVFDDQFIYFSQWGALRENFDYYKSLHTSYVIDMGNPLPDLSFDALTTYVRTKLLWNADLDEKKLIDDFFKAYYKEAEPFVRRYFDECNAFQSKVNETDYVSPLYSQQNTVIKSEIYWKYDRLREWIEVLRKGERAAKTKKVALRVAVQKLTPLYLLLELYADKLERAELERAIEEFERAARDSMVLYTAETGIQYMCETHGKLIKWRSLLLP